MKKTSVKNVILTLSIALLTVVFIIGIGLTTGLKNEKADAYRMPGNSEIARQIGQEGIVLLKNDDNCLPFTSTMKIGGLGLGQDSNFQFGGGGSGWVHAGDANRINPKQGLQSAADAGRIASYTAMGSASGSFDRVIYFITRYSTEGRDIYASDYYLNDVEKNDITSLINVFGKENVVVLLNIPSVIDTTWLIEKDVGAIAVVWMGGEQAGNSIADVLTGLVTPSGKLADTWAKDLQYYPTTKNDWWDSVEVLNTLQNGLNDFGDFGVARYVEDLYVGYRYFETFDPTYELVNYEFGYGLSYTTFDIDVTGVNINKSKGKIKVFAKVTNTGDFSGKEVVQIYYSTPNDIIDSPAKQLIAFAKTETLLPGASQTLTLEFDINEMSQFDDMGVIKNSAYVMQRGDYNIYVGNSIKDSGKRLVATYIQNSNEVIEECSELSTTLDKRLTSDGTYQVINTDGYRVNAAGSSTVQAENYISNTNVKEPFGSDYTAYEHVARYEYGMASGQLLRITSGHTFRYRLYVEKAGTYNIDFIMANGSGNNYTNMLQLFVDYTDDAVDNGVNQNVSVNLDADVNNNWQAWKRVTGNTITFTQTGAVYMTLVCASPCADMDYFVIYNNDVSANAVSEINGANFFYAVNNADTTQGPTIEASLFGLCVGYLHNDRQLKYTVNVQRAGQYYINLNASSCSYASNEVVTLSVGDTAVGNFKVMRTASEPAQGATSDCWYYFEDSSQLLVELPEGEVVLTLDFNNSAITNLKSIKIAPASTGAYSYNWVDNTNDFILKTDYNGGGVSNGTLYTYDMVVRGEVDAYTFLNQLTTYELATMAGLYTGNEYGSRLEDINSGVGGFGGMVNTDLTNKYLIPYAATADGPAGVRFINENNTEIDEFYRYSTYFPCITMLSSTWNTDLAYEFGVAYGQEARAVGVEVMLAPGMNIHRSPLGGRNFEYISEDPYVTGSIATAITLGCQSTGVSVSIKHFAANSQENSRFHQDTKVSPRALREIYLKGFEMVIKNANPGTMMTSYNYVNGVSTGEHYDLITKVVRGEWKWDGVIESDWSENINTGVMVNAGNNLHSCTPDIQDIKICYEQNMLSREKLIENATYIINLLMRTQASSLSESTLPTVEASQKLTCTDGSGTVWDYMEMTNVQIISENKSVYELGKPGGIHGNARLETVDGTTQICYTAEGSGVYGAITVQTSGDYYLAYTLNIGAVAEKYGAFKLFIDGKLVDTFTNPSHLKSTANWGEEDWISESIFVGDQGSKKITLSVGVHRIYVDIDGDGFNMHNIIFSYGKASNQVVSALSGDIDVRNYYEVTGSVRVEGNHIASLHNGTATYKITVSTEGTYGLNYLLNIPGVNNSYGNFTLSINGTQVDAFTNPNKVTTGNDWTTFNWFTGDNGEKQIYLTEGEYTVLFSSDVQEYNVQSIRFRFISPETHSKVAEDASVVRGASVWADKDGQTGKIRFSLSVTDQANLKVTALLVETDKYNDRLNINNYAQYDALKIDCEYVNGKFVAAFDIEQINYSTNYSVVFVISQTTDNLTAYNNVISDSRSCKVVAEGLISAGIYSVEELGYYIV